MVAVRPPDQIQMPIGISRPVRVAAPKREELLHMPSSLQATASCLQSNRRWQQTDSSPKN